MHLDIGLNLVYIRFVCGTTADRRTSMWIIWSFIIIKIRMTRGDLFSMMTEWENQWCGSFHFFGILWGKLSQISLFKREQWIPDPFCFLLVNEYKGLAKVRWWQLSFPSLIINFLIQGYSGIFFFQYLKPPRFKTLKKENWFTVYTLHGKSLKKLKSICIFSPSRTWSF